MLGGWVTFEELQIISGLPKSTLSKLISLGLKKKCLRFNSTSTTVYRIKHKNFLFNLADFERCIKAFLY